MTIGTLQVIAPSTAMPGGPPGVPGPAGPFVVFGINNQTGLSYVAQPSDNATMLIFSTQTVGVTVTLLPNTCVPGWWAIFKNKNVTGQITLLPSGGALIDTLSSMTIDPSAAAMIIFTGLNFESFVGSTDGGSF